MSKASGYSIGPQDVPTIIGMVARGDRDHDIAGWFGVNQGRIAEAKDGKFGQHQPSPPEALPPKGPPGIKGRRPRTDAEAVETLLKSGKHEEALKRLIEATSLYDAHEA